MKGALVKASELSYKGVSTQAEGKLVVYIHDRLNGRLLNRILIYDTNNQPCFRYQGRRFRIKDIEGGLKKC